MMLKIDEINDPTSCLSKAGLDERIFVLIGRDVAAPETIRYWCAKRIQLGKNREGDPQIIEALQCAERMEKERGVVVVSVGVPIITRRTVMENQHREIKGYGELNAEEIAAMNEVKAKGAELGELVAKLKANADLDQRWVSIGATELQQGLMALTRAIAKPTFF